MTPGNNEPGETMTLNLAIEVGRLRGSRLVEDYLDNAPGPAPFFPGSPWDLDAYRRKFESAPATLRNPILLGTLLIPLGLMPRHDRRAFEPIAANTASSAFC